jgi:hypothetical protein
MQSLPGIRVCRFVARMLRGALRFPSYNPPYVGHRRRLWTKDIVDAKHEAIPAKILGHQGTPHLLERSGGLQVVGVRGRQEGCVKGGARNAMQRPSMAAMRHQLAQAVGTAWILALLTCLKMMKQPRWTLSTSRSLKLRCL